MDVSLPSTTDAELRELLLLRGTQGEAWLRRRYGWLPAHLAEEIVGRALVRAVDSAQCDGTASDLVNAAHFLTVVRDQAVAYFRSSAGRQHIREIHGGGCDEDRDAPVSFTSASNRRGSAGGGPESDVADAVETARLKAFKSVLESLGPDDRDLLYFWATTPEVDWAKSYATWTRAPDGKPVSPGALRQKLHRLKLKLRSRLSPPTADG